MGSQHKQRCCSIHCVCMTARGLAYPAMHHGTDIQPLGVGLHVPCTDANCNLCCNLLRWDMRRCAALPAVPALLTPPCCPACTLPDNVIFCADVDLGVSLLGMQYLEMNSTKELFWRHGYVLYQYAVSGWWKVRPHLHHPDPAFRSAFRSYGENTDEYEKRNGDGFHVYIDVWPMWPVPANTTDCEKDLGIDPAPLLTVPWDSAFAELKKGSLEAVDTCSKAFEPASHSSGAQEQVYCKFFQATPLNITPGTRLAKMHNHSFPISTNYER